MNHPEYPSGHSCWTGAVVEALAAFFGTREVPFTMKSTVTQSSRRYANLSDAMAEVTEARIYAGLHFRGSMIDGEKLGRDVARVVSRKFRPT